MGPAPPTAAGRARVPTSATAPAGRARARDRGQCPRRRGPRGSPRSPAGSRRRARRGSMPSPTRVMPPLVTTRARAPLSACARSRSLSPGVLAVRVRGVEDGDAGGQRCLDRRPQQRRLDTHAAQADAQLVLAQPAGHALEGRRGGRPGLRERAGPAGTQSLQSGCGHQPGHGVRPGHARHRNASGR